jgi:hypothetical protein
VSLCHVEVLHVGVGRVPAFAIAINDGRTVAPSLMDWLLPYVVAVGVGNDPNAIPSVRGADGGRRYTVPLRIIPARGQLSENTSKPSSKERCDILHDDDAGT